VKEPDFGGLRQLREAIDYKIGLEAEVVRLLRVGGCPLWWSNRRKIESCEYESRVGITASA